MVCTKRMNQFRLQRYAFFCRTPNKSPKNVQSGSFQSGSLYKPEQATRSSGKFGWTYFCDFRDFCVRLNRHGGGDKVTQKSQKTRRHKKCIGGRCHAGKRDLLHYHVGLCHDGVLPDDELAAADDVDALLHRRCGGAGARRCEITFIAILVPTYLRTHDIPCVPGGRRWSLMRSEIVSDVVVDSLWWGQR